MASRQEQGIWIAILMIMMNMIIMIFRVAIMMTMMIIIIIFCVAIMMTMMTGVAVLPAAA